MWGSTGTGTQAGRRIELDMAGVGQNGKVSSPAQVRLTVNRLPIVSFVQQSTI